MGQAPHRHYSRTGDLLAVPIIVGMAIGCIGCFLAGLILIKFFDSGKRNPTPAY